MVDANGMQSQLATACDFTESAELFDITGSDGKVGIEIKWKKAAITTAGTYMTGGIVPDLSLFALSPEPSSATGMVTFTTYDAPDAVAGTFQMTVPNGAFSASGSFDCK